MSQKLLGFLIHFCNLYCNMNVDEYEKIWIFYSNIILQRIAARSKAPARTRRNQSNTRDEVAIEN